MSRPGRVAGALRTLAALGAPGAIVGALSALAFGFSLIVLRDEYHHPTQTGQAALRTLFEGWAQADDYLGYTLADRVESWQAAPEGPARDRAAGLVRRALGDLGAALDRDDARLRLIRVGGLDVGPAGAPPIASWRPGLAAPERGEVRVARVAVAPGGGPGRPAVDLAVRYQVARPVADAVADVEASYHRLLLALMGLSGYSLLCLGYMARHARGQRERAAREAAAAATLELADRTCHELGNAAFVVANERRNLAEHIDLLDRFVAEDAEALAAASRRAGLDPAAADRLARALRREYAGRGIDPAVELKGSAAIAREVCRQIATCSEYIALTVRELDGHLRRAGLPVEPGPVALGAVVADALALLAPKIEAASARVEGPDPSAPPVVVRADRRLLIHALVNLIKNAIEAGGAGDSPPAVAVSASTAGPTAWLDVADRGPGLASAQLRRIFEPGYTTKAAGRGLGLAIVRESVAAMGGTLDATSRPGLGTTFRIGLPLADPAER